MFSPLLMGCILAAVVLGLISFADGAERGQDVLQTLRKDHPRLLFTAEDQKRIQALAKTDPLLARLIQYNQAYAESLEGAPKLEWVLRDGVRLLFVSRDCLSRVASCSMAYRLTGDRRFAQRAARDMLAVAAFSDWHPKHFLDVAEMTTAVAIGYDWCYEALTDEQRKTIRQAIIRHGLKPGLEIYNQGGWWTTGTNNWNEVCNAGMTMGALAIAEDEPELARQIVARAVASAPGGLSVYAPDGTYPEGPTYWHYGTAFAAAMLSALQTALGDDFGLAGTPGLDKTCLYQAHTASPTGLCFNYADCWPGNTLPPEMFFLSRQYNQPLAAWLHRGELEKQFLAVGEEKLASPHGRDRMFALEIAWYDERVSRPKAVDLPLDAFFRSQQDIVLMRSDWGRQDGLYLGIKGGDNLASHGHLDIGSFVLDAGGVRWAHDLGPDDYNLPGYFAGGPGGARWRYFRLNNLSHNTLTIGGRLQNVKAVAKVTHFASTPPRAETVIDLSAAYEGQAQSVRRGAALLDRRAVLIQDEIRGAKDNIRWAMMTAAEITLDGAAATLSHSGHRFRVEILQPAGAKFEVLSAKPPTAQENQNKGFHILAVSVAPDAQGAADIRILMQPMTDQAPVPAPKPKPLSDWPNGGAK